MNDSLLPTRALRVFSLTASVLWWALVALCLVLVLAWGALHGWIVPRIDQMRPQLEIQASRALGIPVRIGAVSARSDGLVPTFELRDLVLHDAQGRQALHLARVVVSLSPRSLWNLGFEQLVIENPRLDVRRSADGRLWVAGIDVSRGGGGQDSVADWIFSQREVLILGGTLHWTDEQRGAPTLALQDVQFVSRNGLRRHRLRLDATPPPEWGSRFSLRGVFRQPLLSTRAGRWQAWSGQLHAEFASVDLSQLRAYTGWDAQIQDGQGALRAWIDVDHGRVSGGAADVALRQVRVRFAERPVLALDVLAGRLAGKRLPGGFEFETRQLQFETAGGQRWPGGNVAVAWREGQGRHPAQGRLEADRLDLAALARIATHLPLGEATLAALARHAPQGLVESVHARWQGPLDRPLTYEARGRVSGLVLPAGAGLPGVRGAAVDFDLNDAAGKARVQVHGGALDLPDLLAQPLVPVDRLAADLHWRLDGKRIAVDVKGLEFRNADVQGQGHVNWRTGEGPRGPFPGVLDLQLAIARADGARVWRYLPLAVPQDARDYVREAVLAGKASEGQVRVRGDLRDFPFPDQRGGEFRIQARVSDARYDFAPASLLPAGPGRWPTLTDLSGELVFDRQSLQVRRARGRIEGATQLQLQADASIADLGSSTVQVTAQVRGPLAQSLAVFNATPAAVAIGQPLAQATASGAGDLRLRLALPLAQLERSRVQGSLTLAGNDVRIRPDIPPLTRARGAVNFSESGFSLAGVQARALGGELRIEGGTRAAAASAQQEAPVMIRLRGTATADGLRQAHELGRLARLARHASGAAGYEATLGVREAGVDVLVTSNLHGFGLNLPAPLNKAADAASPLRVEWARVAGASRPMDQVSLALGRIFSATYVRDLSGATPRVVRGAIGVGLRPDESAPPPRQGVLANIQLADFSFDAWQDVLKTLELPPGAGPAAAAATVMDYLPTTLALRARELTFQGRTLSNVVVGGSREGLTWRANVDAGQLNGYVEYRQPSGGNPGWVLARLARLSIAATATREVEALLSEQPSSVPALDVVVDDFELRGRRLGRLEIDAVNRGAGGVPAWHLNKLNLTMPEAMFSGVGSWASAGRAPGERRRMVVNFRLDVHDAGLLLARLGMGDVVRRGHGKLEGQVAWSGSPLSLDYPSLSGNVAVNVESGQFLKAEPGLAKLLGVLSLQALPRRLTLDFRDVFSEGFAFDFVRGHMNIEQGIAATNNLQMKGVNAAVLMEGRADLARETQDLKVVVVPRINAGTASLVATVINPAVGLGTFLAQLFLREPLTRAATQELHIDGTWVEPRVTRINRRSEAQAGQDPHVPPAAAQGRN